MKTVVITGGSSGIGLSIAKKYAQQGNNIVLIARNQTRLDEAVLLCEKACDKVSNNSRQKISAFSVDVNDKHQLAQAVNDIQQQFGTVDILVLSAGIIDCIRLLDQKDEDFERVLSTNVGGARLVAKAFLPQMIEKQQGQICFIASLGGLISSYGYSAYGASKFAVVGLAGAMRQELIEHNIGVNVVCPGEVDTPMVADEARYILAQTRFIKDLGGTMEPDVVAKAVINGIRKNCFIIVPGVKAKTTYWFSRFFPKTFAGLMQIAIRYSSGNASSK